MTGDPEWRALYMEFLAHAARDAAFRRAFAQRTDQMRGALEEVVVQRTRPIADALGMEPEQLAVVIDSLGTGLWANHMLHGARAVPPDLFSKALALLVEGIAARAAVARRDRMTTCTDIPRPRFARMYLKAAARADRRGATRAPPPPAPGPQRAGGLKLGAGNGLNFAHYPATVTEVVAIEPEPTLRAVAQQAAAAAPVPVSVRKGTADTLPLADGEMDARCRQPRALQRSRARPARSPRYIACCGRAASCASTST